MTSGEYSYLILRRLQYYVSCIESEWRAYLYNFYGELMNDPSVEITEENYKEICDLMDYGINYAAKYDYIHFTDVDSNYHISLLADVFANMNIILDANTASGELSFKLPSGVTKKINMYDILRNDKIFMHPSLGMTDEYFNQTLPYLEGAMEDVIDLRIAGTNSSGYNTYWSYNENSQTIEITGNGTLVNFLLWEKLKITNIKTLIIGSGVYKLLSGAFTSDCLTIVDFHSEYDEIFIEPNCATNVHLIIYSDNLNLRSYDWDEYGVSVEWYSLSEWDG